MNKDEAERCIDLGLSALKQGNTDKAIRLFKKSLSLYPSSQAEHYLKLATNSPQAKPAQSPAPDPPKPKLPTYKPEQETMCRQILSKTDYYDILGLQKNAPQDEIKKCYRKLALRLHPDKNQAPSSSEAFKKINKAFACLSDEVKRRTYDHTGQEEVHGIEHQHFNNGDFAEHIFREFFNESFFFPPNSSQRTHRSTNHNSNAREQQGNNRIPFMQLLPILILIFLSFASNFQGSSEVYSFHYSSTYSVRMHSENFNVEYYITPKYNAELTHSEKMKLEKNIERNYISYIQQECESQKRKKNTLLNKAKHYKGVTAQNYREYAEGIDLSTCAKYQQLMKT